LLSGAAAAARGSHLATAPIAKSPTTGGGPSSSFTGSGTSGGSGGSEGFEGSEGSGEGEGGSSFGQAGSATFGQAGTAVTALAGPGGVLSGLGVGAVRVLQADLARLGYFHHVVTGYYGPITTRAVKRFQRAAGLKPDGIWGRRSAAALKKRLA